MDIDQLTIARAREDLRNKKYSALELTDAYLARIKERDKEVHAYLEVFEDAREMARAADARRATGEDAPLLGIPLAFKDNLLIKGKKVSAASKILEPYRASYSATATERLQKAGAVILGRTNMDEFAMGGSTENSAFGPTKNPHDLSRVPGGSSGGSAAAIAYGGALAALGSDTGGSVRQPASFCGVVGLKPTYGRVSRNGLIAMGSSLDQIGPLTKTVTDSEILLQIISGHDPLDSTSLPTPAYAPEVLDNKKLRIGVPRSFLAGVDPEVLSVFEASIEKFRSLGYEVTDIELPILARSLALYYILMPAEASTNLARFDGVRSGLHVDGGDPIADYRATRGEGFGTEVRRRILLGTYVLSHGYYDAYYSKAVSLREKLSGDLAKTFIDIDLILTPTSPTPAFPLGDRTADPLSMYLADVFTTPANLSGVPAISLPAGFSSGVQKLPIGIQLMAPWQKESYLFKAGKEFLGESVTL